MKTAISVPDPTFARVDEAAARLGVSRSEFYARAAERWLAELERDSVTARIDATLAAAGDTDENDAFLAEGGRRTTARSPW
ncbi:ribbon-helix-helix domain-containing protein [Patulibacter sp. NPDC049589]|uniref:ribbon-helix-helix domain-containing protein n=1 Tax=Patulibacter sp. NPDC049589 TaxID=3154731 RepID=UPI0034450399